MTANNSKYRTTKDIIIPKGSNVIFVSRMKQEATRKAQALVNLGGGRILRLDDGFRRRAGSWTD